MPAICLLSITSWLCQVVQKHQSAGGPSQLLPKDIITVHHHNTSNNRSNELFDIVHRA
jgi:hypothetical protein